MSQLRRVVPRQPVLWDGVYCFDDSDGSVRRCRVLDISTLGAGVELLDTTVEEVSDRTLIVTVELRGDVRNVIERPEHGWVRAGIEFPGLAPHSSVYVQSLRQLGSQW